MALNRKPFQGVLNIIRFNWHFYIIAIIVLALLLISKYWLLAALQPILTVGVLLACLSLAISLLASYYIYDVSKLYQLSWIQNINYNNLLNVHAGFDETSAIIANKFPSAHLYIADFYNPSVHTEVSIKRARKAYPPNAATVPVSATHLPFNANQFDASFVILAAHEIRNGNERVDFFKELSRVTKGKIYVTEHTINLSNSLAYTIGVFHFYSKKTWLTTFSKANLQVVQVVKTTPFVSTFILEKNDITT
jgi:ubiquinone/menaquinone biosynthesis C-methylase UbiE